MSDKACQEYIASQILSDYKPSQWMHDENLPDDNWEDLGPHEHLAEGETAKVIRVSPKDDECVLPEYIFEHEGGDDEEEN